MAVAAVEIGIQGGNGGKNQTRSSCMHAILLIQLDNLPF